MNDPKNHKSDVPPSPERDTSRKGREEEVINQQEGDQIVNSSGDGILNSASEKRENTGEQQFKEGTFNHEVTIDGVDRENIEGSDRTGGEESSVPGSGI